MGLTLVLSSSFCAYHLALEISALRSFGFDANGGTGSGLLAEAARISGWSQEEVQGPIAARSQCKHQSTGTAHVGTRYSDMWQVVGVVRNRSSMAVDYLRGGFADMVGDAELASELAAVAEKLVLECFGEGIWAGGFSTDAGSGR